MTPERKWMLRRIYSQARNTVSGWRRDAAAWRRFWNSYHTYKAMHPAIEPGIETIYPCLGDDTAQTKVEPVYFYQGNWAFEQIFAYRPPWHVDVASDHFFVALLSKITPVTMIDIRPLSVKLDSLVFREGSVLNMPYEDQSVPSLSSMCVLEHIGLGRYGDPLDPLGTEKAFAELKRVVKPGGYLYVSLPIDDVDRTCFNAHRTFTESTLLKLFQPFEVVSRKYIFGDALVDQIAPGGGTGCYHLRRPE